MENLNMDLLYMACLLDTSDAADDSYRGDLGGLRIVTKRRVDMM